MMQEIKTEEKNFPYNEFKNVGYNSFVSGQKSYNGVAFLSKKNIENINLKFFNDKLNQARIIVGDLKLKTKTIKLINIYVPNGNPIETDKYIYKKNWLELLIKQIEKTKKDYENIIIDKASLKILRGSEIDFVTELMETSFKISNPKTKSSCGCGISFSI